MARCGMRGRPTEPPHVVVYVQKELPRCWAALGVHYESVIETKNAVIQLQSSAHRPLVMRRLEASSSEPHHPPPPSSPSSNGWPTAAHSRHRGTWPCASAAAWHAHDGLSKEPDVPLDRPEARHPQPTTHPPPTTHRPPRPPLAIVGTVLLQCSVPFPAVTPRPLVTRQRLYDLHAPTWTYMALGLGASPPNPHLAAPVPLTSPNASPQLLLLLDPCS